MAQMWQEAVNAPNTSCGVCMCMKCAKGPDGSHECKEGCFNCDGHAKRQQPCYTPRER